MRGVMRRSTFGDEPDGCATVARCAMRRAGLATVLLVAARLAGAAAPLQGNVTLHANTQQWVQELVWCGEGEVEVKYQDVTLKCDDVEVDVRTMRVEARGNVLFDQGETRLACDRLSFDLERKVGIMYGVKGFFPPSYHFRGEELEKLDETHYRLHKGVFSSCNLDAEDAPPWSIDVRDAILELEGYGHFRGVALRTNGVPFFYTPRLLWPIKRDRAAGFLVPNVGYNDRYGFYLGNAFYWPISRSVDATTYIDWWSKGYYGIGEELRWTPAQNASGEMVASMIHDYETGDWEWKARGRYAQLLPGGYALRAEVLDMSDIDFFQRFERTFEQNSVRSFFSHVTLSRTWGPQAFNLRWEHRQTFFDESGVTLERKPELEYRLSSTRVGNSPLYLSMVGVADELRMDRSATQRGRYGRFDLFPTLSLLTPGLPWLNVTPAVGIRETYYTATYSEDRTALVPEPMSRHYFTAGVALVGPSFSRVWTRADGHRIKHLVEPRIEYQYVSNPGDLSRIPVFDEKDSVQVTNRMRGILSNRLLVKSRAGGSREVALFEIGQEYSFSDPLTFARPGLSASKRGPLQFSARYLPRPQTTIDARAEVDPVTNRLRGTALSGGFFAAPGSVNLTWYSSYDSTTGSVVSSQTRVAAGYGPSSKPWRIETQLAYDIFQEKMLEQRYIMRWRGSCWTAFAEIRDYRGPYPTRDYRIAIDFTGLGTFIDIRGGLDSLGF
ncbi:MAG: lptD [Deltaproteobacteria bacterium]|nr:lptD [Deltaproteobacteria bacterium]